MIPRRPRLLFLAYSFPPVNRVGAVRAYNEVKSLASLGWEITVVTPRPSVWSSVDRPDETRMDLQHRGIRRLLTDHRLRFLSNDSLAQRQGRLVWAAGGLGRKLARMFDVEREAGWVPDTERAIAGLVHGDIDLIYASGPPFVSFRIAKRLAARVDRPYVLGYRDLWAYNPHVSSRRSATAQEERSLLLGAAAVVTISQGLRESLRQRFELKDGIHVVTNGYDPADLEAIDPYRFGHFAIVYAGVFYPPKRVIDPLMDAIRLLKAGLAPATVPWAFHYYGVHGAHVQAAAERFGVQDKVILHGPVSRREALSAIRGAGIAVVIASVLEEGTVEDRGIVTGKVFDAIGLGTPFVAVAPSGSDLQGILEVSGLGRRFAGTESEGIAAFIVDTMSGLAPKARDPETFSWPRLGRKLDEILRSPLTA